MAKFFAQPSLSRRTMLLEATPMDPNEATDHLAAIRRIMESASQLTVLPGGAAVIGGLLAVLASAATARALGSLDFGTMNSVDPALRFKLVALWVTVALLGIAVDVLMTLRLAKKHGANPWSRLAQLAAYAMGPFIAAGVAFTVALASHNAWQLVPGVWITLYGGAVWMAGLMSVRAPGVLGLAFFIAGVLTLFWAGPVALVMVALTFGLGHIIFGVYLLARFGN